MKKIFFFIDFFVVVECVFIYVLYLAKNMEVELIIFYVYQKLEVRGGGLFYIFFEFYESYDLDEFENFKDFILILCNI